VYGALPGGSRVGLPPVPASERFLDAPGGGLTRAAIAVDLLAPLSRWS